jgi:hypothetical protein
MLSVTIRTNHVYNLLKLEHKNTVSPIKHVKDDFL